MRHVADGELEQAVDRLGAYVTRRAEVLSAEVGFSWVESPLAPSTFDAVLAAYFSCLESGDPLPVAINGSSTTIYPSRETNAAFRFWHDITHVRLHCTFDYWDERAVAEFHLSELEVSGFPPNSLEWQLLRADTIGQNEFARLSGGGFVADQRAFALSAVEHGLGLALLHELALPPQLSPAVSPFGAPVSLRLAA